MQSVARSPTICRMIREYFSNLLTFCFKRHRHTMCGCKKEHESGYELSKRRLSDPYRNPQARKITIYCKVCARCMRILEEIGRVEFPPYFPITVEESFIGTIEDGKFIIKDARCKDNVIRGRCSAGQSCYKNTWDIVRHCPPVIWDHDGDELYLRPDVTAKQAELYQIYADRVEWVRQYHEVMIRNRVVAKWDRKMQAEHKCQI
jgi:hypothetical protein